MKENKLSKDVLTLLVFTLITVLSWVGFSVWATFNKTTINKATKEQMAPLNPKINREILESLKKTISISEEEMKIPISIPISTPSSNLELESTSAANLESTPTAELENETSQTTTESAIVEETR